MKYHMRKFRQIRAGFTVVELLIYMGLLSILIVVLSQMFVTALNVQLESQATSSVDQDSTYVIARLSYDMQRADQIDIPASLGATTSELQLTIDGVSSSYQLNNGNLAVTRSGQTTQLNGYDSQFSSLSFQRLGNVGGENTIQVTGTVVSRTQANTLNETKDIQVTIGLRENN